ncbi:hypothetical protein M513_14095, partial [Trichuris suis]
MFLSSNGGKNITDYYFISFFPKITKRVKRIAKVPFSIWPCRNQCQRSLENRGRHF